MKNHSIYEHGKETAVSLGAVLRTWCELQRHLWDVHVGVLAAHIGGSGVEWVGGHL